MLNWEFICSLLPADYCHLELVSTSSGCDSETDWKRDKEFNGKALIRKAREADQVHNCQLGKLASVFP